MKKQQKHDHFKNVSIAPLFQEIPRYFQSFFSRNEPNFKSVVLNTNTGNREVYDGFYAKNPPENEPKRTQLKPIQKKLKNLQTQDPQGNTLQKRTQTNPIQTQTKPNTNPIKPNFKPDICYYDGIVL